MHRERNAGMIPSLSGVHFMKSTQWFQSMLLVPPFLLLFAIDVSPGCASGGELLGAENRPTHDASVRSPSDAKLMEDTGMERSASDAIVDSSAPCAPTGKEACDGLDNDCNGLVDEDFICVLGYTKGPVCVT
ncbi:MAG: MopE-related protein, partial [Patescibacteria group bacterium]